MPEEVPFPILRRQRKNTIRSNSHGFGMRNYRRDGSAEVVTEMKQATIMVVRCYSLGLKMVLQPREPSGQGQREYSLARRALTRPIPPCSACMFNVVRRACVALLSRRRLVDELGCCRCYLVALCVRRLSFAGQAYQASLDERWRCKRARAVTRSPSAHNSAPGSTLSLGAARPMAGPARCSGHHVSLPVCQASRPATAGARILRHVPGRCLCRGGPPAFA